MFRAPSASSLALALLVFARVAHAGDEDDKRLCLKTYVDGQAARQEGKLRASQRALDQCGREVCPVIIRNDCVRWLREVTDAMPSVVLSATDSEGRDRADVRVTIDGQPLAGPLDGRPQPIDPGEHVFRFEMPGATAIERRLVVRQGEKDRAVVGAFPRAAHLVARATSPASTGRPVPTTAWIFGGVGAASLLVSATFAGLGWFGHPGWSSSQSCKPSCSPSDVSLVKEHFAIADVAGGIAVVSLGTAAVLFLSRPERRDVPRISLTLAPSAVGVSYGATF